jgi:hypothetical protein
VQDWSDACRRCKCDLRLLREVAGAYRRSYDACLAHLLAGRSHSAWRASNHCYALTASDEARRLNAVSALLDGDWHAAAAQSILISTENVS